MFLDQSIKEKERKKKKKKLDKNISAKAEVAERYAQVYIYIYSHRFFARGEKFARKENRDRGEEGAMGQGKRSRGVERNECRRWRCEKLVSQTSASLVMRQGMRRLYLQNAD